MNLVYIKGVKPLLISILFTVFWLEIVIMLVLGLIYWWHVPNDIFITTSIICFLLSTIIGWKFEETHDTTLIVNQSEIKYLSKNTEYVVLLSDVKSIHIERKTTGYSKYRSYISFQLLDKNNCCLIKVDQWQSCTNVFAYADYLSVLTGAKVIKQSIFSHDPGESFFYINFDHVNQPKGCTIIGYDVVVTPAQEMIVTSELDKTIHWVIWFFLVIFCFCLIFGYLEVALATSFIAILLAIMEKLEPVSQKIILTKGKITYSKAFLNRKKQIVSLNKFRVVSIPYRYGTTYHIVIQSGERWYGLAGTTDVDTALNLAKEMANHMDLPIEVDARIAHEQFK